MAEYPLRIVESLTVMNYDPDSDPWWYRKKPWRLVTHLMPDYNLFTVLFEPGGMAVAYDRYAYDWWKELSNEQSTILEDELEATYEYLPLDG